MDFGSALRCEDLSLGSPKMLEHFCVWEFEAKRRRVAYAEYIAKALADKLGLHDELEFN